MKKHTEKEIRDARKVLERSGFHVVTAEEAKDLYGARIERRLSQMPPSLASQLVMAMKQDLENKKKGV